MKTTKQNCTLIKKKMKSHDQYYDREKKILHLLGTGTIPILKILNISANLTNNVNQKLKKVIVHNHTIAELIG